MGMDHCRGKWRAFPWDTFLANDRDEMLSVAMGVIVGRDYPRPPLRDGMGRIDFVDGG